MLSKKAGRDMVSDGVAKGACAIAGLAKVNVVAMRAKIVMIPFMVPLFLAFWPVAFIFVELSISILLLGASSGAVPHRVFVNVPGHHVPLMTKRHNIFHFSFIIFHSNVN